MITDIIGGCMLGGLVGGLGTLAYHKRHAILEGLAWCIETGERRARWARLNWIWWTSPRVRRAHGRFAR